ncbi:hypothetical protein [Streptomyces sp. NPDC059753]|uniref:hypothetical protein n=1 Tax=Streptomyces sp. NPDC059753 TaxID=3346933 RepID=UPI0036645311
MSALARAADRLARGSSILWERRTAALTAWIRKGRRDDLTGWRAAIGCWARLILVGILAWTVWSIVRAVPWLCGLLLGAWCRAAWRAGRALVEQPIENAPAAASPVPDVEAVRGLLLTLIGEGAGVHLRTVLAHLQEHGQWEGRTVTDLRSHLARLGVPTDRSVKVRGVPTWGVRRRDLAAPSPAEPQTSSTEASPAA